LKMIFLNSNQQVDVMLNKTRFTTDVIIRPDDIDLNNHVHSSRYMDFVLYARYDQMKRCYGFGMDDFISLGFGWVMTDSYMQFKRALVLDDIAEVTTWVESFNKSVVEIHFIIYRKLNHKEACSGWFKYSMVDLSTMKAAIIPANIVEKYTI